MSNPAGPPKPPGAAAGPSNGTPASPDHAIARGEYLALLASRAGFRDYRAILNEPANAAIKKQRTNPQSLALGDVVRIPNLEPAAFDRSSDQFHRLVVASGRILVNLRLDDQSRRPFDSRPGQLTIGGRSPNGSFVVKGPVPSTTGADGRLDLNIGGEPVDGEFVITPPPDDASAGASFRFLIGQLEPVDTPRGMRARLTNLGYFAGASDDDDDQLEWAFEEFQCDEKLPDSQRGFRPGDRRKMLPTWNALAKRHGDMLPGEELTE